MEKSRELPRCPPMIELGDYEVDTWYSSPYPKEYVELNKIFICEFCLSYLPCSDTLLRHNIKCRHFCPPANEIYRSLHEIVGLGTTELSVYEADGGKCKLYCQNLCLLAKLFLDHKTLYYDVEPFLFYILTKNDHIGSRIVGYFSKEKHCTQKNNVSCIMILPQYQKYGFGGFLIEFSYLLSKKENSLGTPEKPLSDLGRISYTNYWKYSILKVIKDKNEVSIKDISDATHMTTADIISALESTQMLQFNPEKKTYSIQIYKNDLEKLCRPRLSVEPDGLRWVKYLSLYLRRDRVDEDERMEVDSETETALKSNKLGEDDLPKQKLQEKLKINSNNQNSKPKTNHEQITRMECARQQKQQINKTESMKSMEIDGVIKGDHDDDDDDSETTSILSDATIIPSPSPFSPMDRNPPTCQERSQVT